MYSGRTARGSRHGSGEKVGLGSETSCVVGGDASIDELCRCFVLFMGAYDIAHKDAAPGQKGSVEGSGAVADISMLCGGAGLLLDGETRRWLGRWMMASPRSHTEVRRSPNSTSMLTCAPRACHVCSHIRSEHPTIAEVPAKLEVSLLHRQTACAHLVPNRNGSLCRNAPREATLQTHIALRVSSPSVRYTLHTKQLPSPHALILLAVRAFGVVKQRNAASTVRPRSHPMHMSDAAHLPSANYRPAHCGQEPCGEDHS